MKKVGRFFLGAFLILIAFAAFYHLRMELRGANGPKPIGLPPTSVAGLAAYGKPITFTYMSRAPYGPMVQHIRSLQAFADPHSQDYPYLVQITDKTRLGRTTQVEAYNPKAPPQSVWYSTQVDQASKTKPIKPRLRIDRIGQIVASSVIDQLPDGIAMVTTDVASSPVIFHSVTSVNGASQMGSRPMTNKPDFANDHQATNSVFLPVTPGLQSVRQTMLLKSLTPLDLKGITISYFGASHPKSSPSGTVTATLKCSNRTMYMLNSLQLTLTLYAQETGGENVSQLFHFAVPNLGLMPFQTMPLASRPMPIKLPAGAKITGYWITLQGAKGLQVPDNPQWSLADKFMSACADGNLTQAQSLLQKRPSLVNQMTKFTKSYPIDQAAEGNHAAVIGFLLNHGANIEAHDFCGRTPLAVAVDYQAVDAVRILLAHGANPSVKEFYHVSILKYEEDMSKLDGEQAATEIAAMLQQHGAKATAH